MGLAIEQFCKRLEFNADKVRLLTRDFCALLGLTCFGYVRVYPNGRVSWLTTNPDQDRFLLESGALDQDPHLDMPGSLKKGSYLWFNDRQFPGCEDFYRERARRHRMDHGLIVVRHQKKYMETCCFSGLLSKRPLYNVFINDQAVFGAFMEHFIRQLDRRQLDHLEQGLVLNEIKSACGRAPKAEDRKIFAKTCGWDRLLTLSKREKECLVLLRQGHTYQKIGLHLKLSERTVEHYIDSVKNKLAVDTRAELVSAAEKIIQLGL